MVALLALSWEYAGEVTQKASLLHTEHASVHDRGSVVKS